MTSTSSPAYVVGLVGKHSLQGPGTQTTMSVEPERVGNSEGGAWGIPRSLSTYARNLA